jgi:hypothetical protein
MSRRKPIDPFEYTRERVLKSEEYRADTSGFATNIQGQAITRRYLPELEEAIRADHSRSQHDKDLWRELKKINDLAFRLLVAGIAIGAADHLGVDRHGRKNFRNIALWIGRNLDQDENKPALKVGGWGIRMLQSLPIFFLDDDDVLILLLTDSLDDFLNDVVRRAMAANPFLLPVTTAPPPWTQVQRALPPPDDWAKVSLVDRKSAADAMRSAINRGKMWMALDAINALQEVPFVIDKPVFEVTQKMRPVVPPLPESVTRTCTLWKVFFPHSMQPVIPDLPDWLTRKESVPQRLAEKSKAAQQWLVAQRKAVAWDLDMIMAEMMVTEERFYILLKMDFRGRLYGVPYFNFQRADHVRGVFRFADGEPIGPDGLLWLKAHVAARADGNDWSDVAKPSKLNFEQRIAWTERHLPRLQRIGEDVLSGIVPSYLPDPDEEPIQFLAACTELTKALQEVDPSSFVTHLPLTFDASCSGLQHLSAMTRDEVGGRLSNLIPSNKGEDFYERVAIDAVERFDTTGRWFVHYRDAKDKHRLKRFPNKEDADQFAKTVNPLERPVGHIDAKIDRKLVKRPAMTYFYGATWQNAMTEQVADVLKERGLPTTGARHIAHAIYDAVEEAVPRAKAVRDFLQDLAGLCADHGRMLRWTTPLGVPVLNLAEESEVERNAVTLKGGRRKYVNLAIDHKDEVNEEKARRRVPPNFVHALDAAHLQMVADMASGEGIAMTSVHDCFGCLASRGTPQLHHSRPLHRTSRAVLCAPEYLVVGTARLAGQCRAAARGAWGYAGYQTGSLFLSRIQIKQGVHHERCHTKLALAAHPGRGRTVSHIALCLRARPGSRAEHRSDARRVFRGPPRRRRDIEANRDGWCRA